MGYKIDKLGPVIIMEPKVRTKIKFLQKIFIKLFGYKEVCTFSGGGISDAEIERHANKKLIKINTNPGPITFTIENAKWNEKFIEEIRKE